jgi:hypothetical protein
MFRSLSPLCRLCANSWYETQRRKGDWRRLTRSSRRNVHWGNKGFFKIAHGDCGIDDEVTFGTPASGNKRK